MTEESIALEKNIVGGHRSRETPGRTHDLALVVGVEHYPGVPDGDLRGAIGDAEQFYAWLVDPEGGRVASDHARFVASRPEPPTPIQDQVDDALLALLEIADQLGGARRIYIYFSGHGVSGVRDQQSDLALLLAKWSQRRSRVALSAGQYSGNLRCAGLFQEVAIFLDCCRTVGVDAVGVAPSVTFRATRAPLPEARMFIAHASEGGQPAIERRIAGRWGGVFTQSLLTILRRSQGGIAAPDLKRALQREVQLLHATQRAEVVDGLHETSRFGHRSALPELCVARVKATGAITLLDGSYTAVERWTEIAMWRGRLPLGLYKLVDDAGLEQMIEHHREVTHVEF
jgi:hypothetical protein